MIPAEFKIPKGYRKIKPGEKIQTRDLMLDEEEYQWVQVGGGWVGKIKDERIMFIRRKKIEKEKEARYGPVFRSEVTDHKGIHQ